MEMSISRLYSSIDVNNLEGDMYKFTAALAKVVFFFIAKIDLKNAHKLPANGGYVITCAHRGWLEIIALGISLPRPIHFMAKKRAL